MNKLLAALLMLGMTLNFCAQINPSGAIRFYERLGFKLEEPRKFGEDNCLVYRITWEDWKY
jgi:ribosomal protein S18 acetylase RimI-like enzyme